MPGLQFHRNPLLQPTPIGDGHRLHQTGRHRRHHRSDGHSCRPAGRVAIGISGGMDETVAQPPHIGDGQRPQPAPDRRQSDAGRLGPRQKHLIHRINIPDGPRPHIPFPRDGHIHQRHFLPPVRRPHQQRLADDGAIRQVNAPVRHQAGGNARQRTLHHHRKDVVGAGGNRHDGQLAGTHRHRPIRAVAAQRNQAAHLIPRGQQRGGAGRVALGVKRRHRQHFHGDIHRRIVRRPPAQMAAVGHRHHPLHAGGLQAHQRAPDDVHLFPIRHDPALRHQPANILAGGGIGNDSNGCHLRKTL